MADALQRLGERHTAATGTPVEVVVDAAVSIPAGHEVVVFRAAQEALTNVAKHADAVRVRVELAGRQGEATRLVVRDEVATPRPDGDATSNGRTGQGLAVMRDRVERVGGRLDVEIGSSGSTVTVELPSQVPPTADGRPA